MVRVFVFFSILLIIISHNRPSRSGYSCPRCDCKVCSIPSDCPLCQLTLISSSHLARSYHHLFPVSPFRSENVISSSESVCFCCTKNILNDAYADLLFRCEICLNIFCSNCDSYIHENLHNCPGCLLK
jgi:transcription initiation factor TFIIH subunit 2